MRDKAAILLLRTSFEAPRIPGVKKRLEIQETWAVRKMPNFLPRSHAYDISVTLASAGKWGEKVVEKMEKVVRGVRDLGRVVDPANPDFSKVTPNQKFELYCTV